MEAFDFLGMTVYPYGLCIAVATLAALALMGWLGFRRGMPAGTARVFALLAIPLGILCARALYCAVNINLFVGVWERPALMLNFFDGGLSMPGLLAGLVLAAWIAARIKKARFATLLDALCAPLSLLIAAERFAERFTELGVGKVVKPSVLTENMPWLFISARAGKTVEYRLAVMNYEAAVALLIFALMLVLFLTKGQKQREGDLALLFFSLYGASQTMLESMRDDGHMLIIFLRVGQLLAALMPVIATAVLSRRYAHLRGRAGRRVALGWVVVALCVLALVFLEFSLDGRITVGNASMTRDYLIMLAVCAALCAVPCSLVVTLNRRAYRFKQISVRASVD